MSCCENPDIATPPHRPPLPIIVTNQRKYTSGSNSASGFPKVLIALIIAFLFKHLLPVTT